MLFEDKRLDVSSRFHFANICIVIFLVTTLSSKAYSYEKVEVTLTSQDYPLVLSFRGVFLDKAIMLFDDKDVGEVQKYPELQYLKNAFQILREGRMEEYLAKWSKEDREQLLKVYEEQPDKWSGAISYSINSEYIVTSIIEHPAFTEVGTVAKMGTSTFIPVTYRLVRLENNKFLLGNVIPEKPEDSFAKVVFLEGVERYKKALEP